MYFSIQIISKSLKLTVMEFTDVVGYDTQGRLGTQMLPVTTHQTGLF